MKKIYKKITKPFSDFIAAILLLLILSPIIVALIFILSIVNRGEIFFFQLRPGLNKKPFHIWKFKSMNDKKDAKGNLLPDRERITIIGRFIRDYSLDEILQLINVIKGEMSFVGPRPLLMKYLPLYSQEQSKRHDVKPGITGLAQINGRNTLNWNERFELDLKYVNCQSFLLDFKILLLTLKKVVKREGINESDSITMSEFKGN